MESTSSKIEVQVIADSSLHRDEDKLPVADDDTSERAAVGHHEHAQGGKSPDGSGSVTKPRHTNKYKCRMCGETFPKKIDMHVHRLSHIYPTENDNLECDKEKKGDTSVSHDDEEKRQICLNKMVRTLNQMEVQRSRKSNKRHPNERGEAIRNLEEYRLNFIDRIPYLSQESLNLESSVSKLSEKFPIDILLPFNSKTYRCRPCQIEFDDYRSYLHHREDHPNPKLYDCQTCGKGFTVKGNLQRHEQIHNNVRQFQCGICEKKFSQKTHLVAHMGVHSRQRPFICHLCGATFKRESSILRHKLIHDRCKDASASLPAIKQANCEDATEKFVDKPLKTETSSSKENSDENGGKNMSGQSQIHFFDGDKIKSLSDEKASTTVDEKNGVTGEFKDELSQSNCQDTQEYIGKLSAASELCKFQSRTQHGVGANESASLEGSSVDESQMHPHSMTAEGELNSPSTHFDSELFAISSNNPKTYKCSTCYCLFSGFQSYMIHKQQHPTPKLFSCEVCGKSFTIKGNLGRHLQIHKDIRIHECLVCNKKFSQKTHLEAHQLVHSKERPHICSLCSSSFTRAGNLRRHLRTHSVPRLKNTKEDDDLAVRNTVFECLECQKTFTRKGNLQRHQKLHVKI